MDKVDVRQARNGLYNAMLCQKMGCAEEMKWRKSQTMVKRLGGERRMRS